MGAETKLTWRVEGMDCAACVAKVTKAVERVPGVSAVQVNLMAERLTLQLDDAGKPEAVEAQVTALGYGVKRLDGAVAGAAPAACGHEHHHDHKHKHDHDHAPTAAKAAEPAGHAHNHADHDDPADATKP